MEPGTVRKFGGIEFVYIPAGEFMMGSPSSEKDRSKDEGPQHEVELSAFWMSKYEVTKAQWKAVVNDNCWRYFEEDNLPVEDVSWDECQEFISEFNIFHGEKVRLPTEAEWEYACRAGTTTVFHYGDSLSSSQANFDGNYPYGGAAEGEYRKETMPVGSFKPNAWGLYDMHGNVWEWCADWYGEDYYGKSLRRNPTGPSSGSSRVFRGGGWNNYAMFCRSASRYKIKPLYQISILGFRLARPALR